MIFITCEPRRTNSCLYVYAYIMMLSGVKTWILLLKYTISTELVTLLLYYNNPYLELSRVYNCGMIYIYIYSFVSMNCISCLSAVILISCLRFWGIHWLIKYCRILLTTSWDMLFPGRNFLLVHWLLHAVLTIPWWIFYGG